MWVLGSGFRALLGRRALYGCYGVLLDLNRSAIFGIYRCGVRSHGVGFYRSALVFSLKTAPSAAVCKAGLPAVSHGGLGVCRVFRGVLDRLQG